VEPLDLTVEYRRRHGVEAELVPDDLRERDLVLSLDGAEARAEVRVVHVRLEVAEPLEVGHPAGADPVRDERRERGVAREQPSARRDAVGLVVEPLGVELVEIAEELALNQLAV
jgi:hypothetical protein